MFKLIEQFLLISAFCFLALLPGVAISKESHLKCENIDDEKFHRAIKNEWIEEQNFESITLRGRESLQIGVVEWTNGDYATVPDEIVLGVQAVINSLEESVPHSFVLKTKGHSDFIVAVTDDLHGLLSGDFRALVAFSFPNWPGTEVAPEIDRIISSGEECVIRYSSVNETIHGGLLAVREGISTQRFENCVSKALLSWNGLLGEGGADVSSAMTSDFLQRPTSFDICALKHLYRD